MSIDREELRDVISEALSASWKVRAVSWTSFRDELLATYRDGLRAPGTLRAMRHDLGMLDALVALDDAGQPILDDAGQPVPLVRLTSDLTVQTIARYVQSMPPHVSPATIRSRLRSVRAACNVAVRTGRLQVSPFALRNLASWVRVPRLAGKRTLSRAEIRAILDVLSADVAQHEGWNGWRARRLQALVAVLVYCGLRAGEALHLRVADVDIPGRTIHVRPHKTYRLKTETSAAPVPMPEALVPILTSWLAHRMDAPTGFRMPPEVPWLIPGSRRRTPWVGGCPGVRPLDVFKSVAVRAGVEHATFQMLRRALSTHLRAHGVSGGIASKVLRHDPTVDEEFYHCVDIDNLKTAVKDFDY